MLRKSALIIVFSFVAALVGIPASTAVAVEPVFRDSASANSNTLNPTVTVPASVQAGDQLVLIISYNTDSAITTPPTGWTELGTAQDGTPDFTSVVYTRTAGPTDAGTSVTTPLARRSKTAITLVAYAGATPALDATSSILTGSSTDLTTPGVATVATDSIVLSYWANKSGGNTGWALPGNVTSRASSIGSGGGRVTAAIGDTVALGGAWSGATATSSVSASKGIAWTIVLPTADTGGNADPVADFTAECNDLECSFDASGSSDDGGIVSYDWNFGDGTVLPDAGVNPTHTFGDVGAFDVTLTVTDTEDATASLTQTVNVTIVGPSTLEFRAASSANANTLFPSVALPASVQDGDQLVMIVSFNTNTSIATPAGWTLLGTEQDGTPDFSSAVYTRTADAATGGSTVSTPLGRRSKTAVTVVGYGGATPALAATSSILTGSSADLTSPAVTVDVAGSMVLSYWANKSGGNTSWTLPGNVEERATSIGSGGGRVTAAIGDTIAPAGAWPGATATSSVSASKGIAWTIVLAPVDTNTPPTAAFTSDCTYLDCTFTDGSTDDGTIQSWAWDFGDGATSIDQNPSHSFAAAGDYTVTLTVTDDDSGTDSFDVVVSVLANEPPVALFTPSCVDLVCSFDASASNEPNGTIDTYDWDFGDENVGTGVNPDHTFGAAGDYTVILTVTDDDGQTNTTSALVTVTANEPPVAAFTPTCTFLDCSFDATASAEPNGGPIATFDWDFGDGTLLPDGGATPNHSYATAGDFDVTLTVTDDDGQTNAVTIQVTTTVPPNEPPVAAFTADCTLLSCDFDGSSSNEPNGGPIARFDWDFGDGNTADDAGATQNHAYATAGDYTVTLLVTDDDGQTNSTQLVVSPIANADPTAGFTIDCDNLACSFTDTSTDDGTITAWAWSFGDGNTSTAQNPSNTYAGNGTYDVTLTVTDDMSATDEITLPVTVAANVAPTAVFTPNCDGLVCTFDAIDSTDTDGTIVSYDWDFGDGDSATGANPPNNFMFPGDYDVTLTVTDDDDATGMATLTLTVDLPAVADIQLPPDTPRTDTPRIRNGEITDLEYIGSRVYVVGSFTSVDNSPANGGNTVNQRFVTAFDIDTGEVDTNFRPTFAGGGVTEIARSPDGSKLFVVGRFNEVNGITRRKIASIDPVTGATITDFSANANSAATAVAATNDTVYVGGQFSLVRNTPKVGLVAVDADSGQLVGNFQNDMSGGIGVNGALTVQALVLTPDETKLLVVHTGRQIAGQDRYGIGLIDTTDNQLLPWRTRLWDDNLARVGGIQRIYAGAISPDGTYFVVGSGSGGDRPPISDTVLAYPIEGGDNMEPLWISRMFDSIYSLAVTDDAVFAGGHMNYMESPTAPDPWPGLDTTGYGRGQGLSGYGLGDDIVVRQHIGAIDPLEGKAVEWNPGSNSFEGNKAMLVHPRGIITGGDANIQGGISVGRIAVYDYDSVPAVGQNETSIIFPIEGRVEEADAEFLVGGMATAASGVQRMQLEVISNGQYLQDDLTTWGGWNGINVNLQNPGATETVWTQALTISGNREITLRARTFAQNGTRDGSKATKKIETFGLADATPNTRITDPRGLIPTLDFTAFGTADDDLGVTSILISLRDSNLRYLQDDGSVDDVYNTFRIEPDVVGATEATWSYDVTVPYEGEWRMQAIAVDTSGQSDLRSSTRTWIVNESAERPTVSMVAPTIVNPPTVTSPIELLPGSPLTFSGTATDDEGLKLVEIRLRNSTTGENLASDGTWGVDAIRRWYRISPPNISGTSYNWSYTTPFDLVPGRYEFEVRAEDDLELTTSSSLRARLTINVVVPGDSPPDARLDVTGDQFGVQVLEDFLLTGTATDDIGVDAVRVSLRDIDTLRYIQPDGTMAATQARLDAVLADPGATATTWSLNLDLPTQGDWYVTAYGYDTSGQQDTSTSGAIARYRVYPGDLPPEFVEGLFSPPEGTVFTEARVVVSGRIEDDQQIARVQVAIQQNSSGLYMNSNGNFTSSSQSWRTAFLNSPGSPGSNFSYTSPAIPDGDYTVYARGIDQHDFVTPVPNVRNVTVTGPPGNLPPVADFAYSCVENVCSFDASSSTDENAPTLTYTWDFGNGSGSGAVPERTYTSAGTYTVTVTARDEYGLTDTSDPVDIVITEPTGNQAPIAVINPPSCSLLSCNFSSVGSEDPDEGDSISRLWEWGHDGATSTSTSPSHTFPAPGTYTVILTVTDGWGLATTETYVLDLLEPAGNQPPVPVIDTPVCTLLECTFSNTTTADPEGNPFSVLWDFGDAGATSTSSAPSHTFTAAGTYTVTLTATDVWGRAAFTTLDVTVVDEI